MLEETKVDTKAFDELSAALATETAKADFAREITDEVNAMLPAEKRKAEAQMRRTAEEMKREDLRPTKGDGRGQPVASIPPTIYLRWLQLYPGCWQDRDFVNEFLADNPQCLIPGYKPKAKTIYFDMAGKGRSKGAQIYHQNKKQFLVGESTIFV